MALGVHSNISFLQTRLFLRWIPKWWGAFNDPKGGFFERLGNDFKPTLTGQRRLLSQCRQLAIYSDYQTRKKTFTPQDLQEKFDYIISRYHNPKNGLWHFSLDDDGAVLDSSCDLYALSFVIFSFSHYFRASGDERAKTYAQSVLNLIKDKFKIDGLAGYAESIDDNFRPQLKIRRQNPHMHLLEACLFAYDTWGDDGYMTMADEMVHLFYQYFYSSSSQSLVEFFTDDLSSPHPEKGHVLEAGHYFEWVWLLKKHAKIKGDLQRHDKTCFDLLAFANKHGWDDEFGGIYDGFGADGKVLVDTKRIWPFCEALKANALMLESVHDRQDLKDRMADMVHVFRQKYMKERGFWTEWVARDLTPSAQYMPATTPYHVYFGIVETMDILNKRGDVKSIFIAFDKVLYAVRRYLSYLVRGVRRYFFG